MTAARSTGEFFAGGAGAEYPTVLRGQILRPHPGRADEGAGNLPVMLVRRQVTSPSSSRGAGPCHSGGPGGIASCNLRAWAGKISLLLRTLDSCCVLVRA